MTHHDDLIRLTADRYRLDAELLIAQVLVESSGEPDAFRYEPVFYETYIRDNPKATAAIYGPLAACSFGLLQIMLETACEIGYVGPPHALFTPAIGLEWGARYLRKLMDMYGDDVERALAAYNGGPGAVIQQPYRTLAYAAKVIDQRNRLA